MLMKQIKLLIRKPNNKTLQQQNSCELKKSYSLYFQSCRARFTQKVAKFRTYITTYTKDQFKNYYQISEYLIRNVLSVVTFQYLTYLHQLLPESITYSFFKEHGQCILCLNYFPIIFFHIIAIFQQKQVSINLVQYPQIPVYICYFNTDVLSLQLVSTVNISSFTVRIYRFIETLNQSGVLLICQFVIIHPKIHQIILSLLKLPQVSVVIPAFNSQLLISRALDSVLSQPYPNYNIVIINDGSTDRTPAILKNYSLHHRNIQIFTLTHNRGTLYARSLGIQKSSELIIFLDSDDCLSEDIISKSVQKLTEFNANIVVFDALSENKTHLKWAIQSSAFPKTVFGIQLTQNIINERKMYIQLWGKIFRRELLIKAINRINILISNRIVLSEDLLITAAYMIYSPKVAGLNEIGYEYIGNENGVTQESSRMTGERLYKRLEMDYFARRESIKLFDELYERDKEEYHKCVRERNSEQAQNIASSMQISDCTVILQQDSSPTHHMCEVIVWDSLPKADTCEALLKLIYQWSHAMCKSKLAHKLRFLTLEEENNKENVTIQSCLENNNGKWQNVLDFDELTQMKSNFTSSFNNMSYDEIALQNITTDQIFEMIDLIWDKQEQEHQLKLPLSNNIQNHQNSNILTKQPPNFEQSSRLSLLASVCDNLTTIVQKLLKYSENIVQSGAFQKVHLVLITESSIQNVKKRVESEIVRSNFGLNSQYFGKISLEMYQVDGIMGALESLRRRELRVVKTGCFWRDATALYAMGLDWTYVEV